MKRLIPFSFFLFNLVWAQPTSVESRESKLDVPFYYTVNGGPFIDFADEMLGPFQFLLGPLLRNSQQNANEISVYGSDLKQQTDTGISRSLQPLMCLQKSELCVLLEAQPSIKSEKAQEILGELLVIAKKNKDSGTLEVLKKELEGALGIVKASFILSHLNSLSTNELIQVAGFQTEEDFLVLRRFGYIRNRMEGVNGPTEHTTDHILFDSTHPYVPGWKPPAALNEEDGNTTFLYKANPRTTHDLKVMWGQFSKRFHELALAHYERERLKGSRQIFTQHLLDQLREDNNAIDLERAFFFTVEDYATENVHATIALIDGDSSYRKDKSAYELPVVRNILKVDPKFNLREKFNGRQVFEVHSLAKNPEKHKEIPLESMALLIAEHLSESGFLDSYLLVQTDKAGARRFEKFGFTIHKEASDKLGGEMRVLYVKTSEFVKVTRELYPVRGHINIPLPNPLTKRLGHPTLDAKCLTKLRNT